MFSTACYSFPGISTTAITVILWLSISFWVDAYAQRRDAGQLLVASKAEGDLLDVMRNLSSLRGDQYTDTLDEAADVLRSRETMRSLVSTHVVSLELAIGQLTTNQKIDSVVERTLGSRKTVARRLQELAAAAEQWDTATEFVMNDGRTLAPIRLSVKKRVGRDSDEIGQISR